MIFFSQNGFKLILVRNMIQVVDSIPWVRCASGNVFFNFFQLRFNFFSSTFYKTFFQLFFSTFCQFFSTFFPTFFQFFLLFFKFFPQLVFNFFLFCNCHLHQFQCWPPDSATCIVTLPRNALLTSSVGIELVSSSSRVTSVKSQKALAVCTQRDLDPQIGPQVYLGPIKTQQQKTH